jgi:protein involved in polysaccharide export with SLBB domain
MKSILFICISVFIFYNSLYAIDATSVRPLPFKAGDALKITVLPDTTSFPSGLYPIDGEGYADLPVLGYMKVSQMTSNQLEDTLKKTFVEILRYPNVTVRPLYKITLLGGFQRPGLYWIDPHATLWQTVQLGGATLRSDGFKLLKWERNRIPVSNNLVPYLESSKSLYQIGIKSGDQIIASVRAERTSWEAFRVEVLPMVTFALTSILTTASIYQTYHLLRDERE